MARFLLTALALVATLPAARAWNDKGHMVVARIAWQELTPAERAKVVEILKAHPHYDEFLKAKRPDNIPEDEWVFMRAAAWADWVRGGPDARREYNVPKRHYIDYPFVAAGAKIAPPAIDTENAVSGITRQKQVALLGGDRTKRAVAVTWLSHLVGDIHQPLHAVSYYSEQFPDGDKGGNLVTIKVDGGGVVRLHGFYDGLLGNGLTRASILGTVEEAGAAAANDPAVTADLKAHTTPEDWARESYAVAKRVVYLDGKLKMANTTSQPKTEDIPTAPEGYAKQAGGMARLAVVKGGKRLAGVLREVVAANK